MKNSGTYSLSLLCTIMVFITLLDTVKPSAARQKQMAYNVINDKSYTERMRKTRLDRTCVLLCHSECSMWRGYDLKHCALMCMSQGLENFQIDFCFDMSKLKIGVNSI